MNKTIFLLILLVAGTLTAEVISTSTPDPDLYPRNMKFRPTPRDKEIKIQTRKSLQEWVDYKIKFSWLSYIEPWEELHDTYKLHTFKEYFREGDKCFLQTDYRIDQYYEIKHGGTRRATLLIDTIRLIMFEQKILKFLNNGTVDNASDYVNDPLWKFLAKHVPVIGTILDMNDLNNAVDKQAKLGEYVIDMLKEIEKTRRRHKEIIAEWSDIYIISKGWRLVKEGTASVVEVECNDEILYLPEGQKSEPFIESKVLHKSAANIIRKAQESENMDEIIEKNIKFIIYGAPIVVGPDIRIPSRRDIRRIIVR